MKIVLVGMNNPYNLDPKYALYPHPPQSAGGRLFKMMREVSDGLTMSEYAHIFDRINLVRGDWSRPHAATEAAVLVRKQGYRDRRVVMLGEEVRAAFGRAGAEFPHPQFQWAEMSRKGKWAHIPHPSGRSRAWNSEQVRAEADRFFADLVKAAREAAEERV